MILAVTPVGILEAQSAADNGAQRVALARAKLECFLRERQQQRHQILAEQAKVQEHLRTVDAFRAGLDPEGNAAAISRTDEALEKDRTALRAIAARLAQADMLIAQTKRALAALAAPNRTNSLTKRVRANIGPRVAAALDCGDSKQRSTVAQDSLATRLLATDLCGERTDAAFIDRDGISTDPVAARRLQGILDRLDAVGGQVPVVVLAGCPSEGGGAFATSTTAFIGECQLVGKLSDDEIAFIIAHERAHVRLQHLSITYVTRAFDRLMNGETPEGVNLGRTDKETKRIRATSLAARLGDFDRDQEFDADMVGATDSLSAGFSPRGIAQFFTRAQLDEGEREARRVAALSSEARARDARDLNRAAAQRMASDHPSAADRKRSLEAVFGTELWSVGLGVACR